MVCLDSCLATCNQLNCLPWVPQQLLIKNYTSKINQ